MDTHAEASRYELATWSHQAHGIKWLEAAPTLAIERSIPANCAIVLSSGLCDPA